MNTRLPSAVGCVTRFAEVERSFLGGFAFACPERGAALRGLAC